MAPRKIIRSVLCVAAAICSPAIGQIAASWQPVPITLNAIADDPVLADMQCWDLTVTASGNWYLGALRATLPSGSFYNHPLGVNTKPSAALINFAPALAFDTYVTAPSDGHPGAAAPSVLGGFPMTEPLSMAGNVLSVSWGDLVVDPPGTYPIARLTFPKSVFPDILTMDEGPDFSWTSQLDPDAITPIPEVPEPTLLPFCAAVWAGSLVRARRRGCPSLRSAPHGIIPRA